MLKKVITLAALVLFVSMAHAGDTYCIYVISTVTGKEKAHSCRWFNSYEDCVKAAERIGGRCGAPK